MARPNIAAPVGLGLIMSAAVARGEGLGDYNATGVGERGDGPLHGVAGGAVVDVALGEATVGLNLPFGVVARAGYQYGGYAFAGVSRRGLSLRVGLVPDQGTWGAGLGYGAPLLPMAAVVSGSAARCYLGLVASGLDPRIVDVLASASGPIGDAVSGGPNMPFGFGAQLVARPELGEIAVFVGLQAQP